MDARKPSASAAALRSCSYLTTGSFASRAISIADLRFLLLVPGHRFIARLPFRRGLDRGEELRPDGIVLQPVADVVTVAAIRKQIDDLDRGRHVIEGLRDLLGVLAAGLVGVGQDHDVPVLEVWRQLRRPFGAGALARRGRYDACLAGEIVGVLLALAKVDHGRRRREQLRQPVRNLRARRLALQPLRAVPMKLRNLLLAGAVEIFPDEKIGLAVRVAVDVFGDVGDHLPFALPLAFSSSPRTAASPACRERSRGTRSHRRRRSC